VGRQKEDGRLGRNAPDLEGRAHAIHHRHIDIQNYDIRIHLPGFVYRFFSIGSLTAYLERMLLEKRTKGVAHQCGIVNEEYASSHRSTAGGAGWATYRLPQYVLIFV
jgi:hypothetical protein